jgi:hypothetical protein
VGNIFSLFSFEECLRSAKINPEGKSYRSGELKAKVEEI